MAARPRRRSASLPGHLPQADPGEVLVWTDGACQRNPGPGGWAALVCWEDGVVEEHSGGLALTTNNIMEMTAALEGLRALPLRVARVRGHRLALSARRHDLLDGRLAAQGLENGVGRARSRTRRSGSSSRRRPPAHEQVRWHWVKGHVGHALNERADVLAVAATQDAARAGRTSCAERAPRILTETLQRRVGRARGCRAEHVRHSTPSGIAFSRPGEIGLATRVADAVAALVELGQRALGAFRGALERPAHPDVGQPADRFRGPVADPLSEADRAAALRPLGQLADPTAIPVQTALQLSADRLLVKLVASHPVCLPGPAVPDARAG